MSASLFEKLYGTAVVAKHLLREWRVPYLSDDAIGHIRDQRLRQIVDYAAATVPFYRDFFDQRGVDPADIQSVDDLERLPLIDRETVRKQPQAFVSQSKWGREAIPFATSGSTGTPLTVFHDRYSLLANVAIGQREKEVDRQVLGRGGRRRKLSIGPAQATTGEKAAAWIRKISFVPAGRRRGRISFLDPIERIIEVINERRPAVISCFAGSYLEMLFKTVAARGLRMHLPRAATYRGDALSDAGRRLIEEDFGVRVLSRYNAVEAFKIGFTCEERTGFHLHDDLTHVRIVDPQGQALPPGERGEVVISNLFNRGTVLLNYRLGDVASLCQERCHCGRNLRLLSSLEGRTGDLIYRPDGRFVHYAAIWWVFNVRRDVLQYQLIQHEMERFELKVVTPDRATFDAIVGDLIDELRRLLGESAVVEAAYHERLEPSAGGKFRPVLSLVEPDW
ncbi:MAG: phenylacetate--CoA ligase family protein [Anaerolineales bacterium]|nr:MAG: phenylacetate--CoA ligase family protein [Anaerolineales bacterium]